ncbi:MAG: HPr(Ser) kinase/phosphatase [Kiritimatiellae bacterium]|nr:HPr(Ser) kinase/phosphatase [Kiritimatiellia bacterium]
MSTEKDGKIEKVTVGTFLETGKKPLIIDLVCGTKGLDNYIIEATLNRPGLALSGFFEHFAYKRIQVIGLAEHAYLSSMSDVDRAKRLRDFFVSKIPCVVLTRGKKAFPEIEGLAEEFNIPVLKTRMVTKHFVNAATIIMENLMAPRLTIQGTMVEILGIGVLIEGKPGMGKSETALSLLKKGHALVADDVTALRVDSSGSIIASPLDVTRYHMEIRGLGIIHVPSLFGVASVREEKRLDLVVTLCQPGTKDEENRGGDLKVTRTLMGVEVPQIFLPVAPGRDLTNVVETAALDQRLRRLGHDAAKELDEKLMTLMNKGLDGSE